MNREAGGKAAGGLGRGALLLAVLAGASTLHAEVSAPRGRLDNRVREVFYEPGQVYRLRGFAGYQIDLEFEQGESFVGLSAGDLDGIAFAGQENHLFLKPKAATVATNITVLTNRRHYRFVYDAAARRPSAEDLDVIFALRFTYPTVTEVGSTVADAARVDSGLADAAAARPQNRDYWYCGSAALRPVSAVDDGVHTRLRFPANGDLPAIFVRGDDGSESLLNYSVEGGDVMIHRVARRFVLRRGRAAGCIENKGFSGSGIRLDSGTVAPDVERRVRGGAR